MRNFTLDKQAKRLVLLVSKATDACGENFEMRAEWARYICVLSAGLVENSIKVIYSDYANRTVSSPVARYVGSNLSRIRNPKASRILETAGAFKEQWQVDLEAYMDLSGGSEAIDSIMNNRHLVAHGQHQNCNLSLVQAKQYLEKAIGVLEFIESQCWQ